MSKVKIQGNASGTGIFTVAAPATNTDRTITLPDTSSTLLAPDSTGSIQLDFAGSNNYLRFISSANYVGRNSSTGDIWLNAQGGQGVNLGIGGTSQLKVDGNGRVTMPSQPAFRAIKSATVNTTSESPVQYDVVDYNIGGHYNNSTYRFTAPVSGRYFISAQFSFYVAGDARQVEVGLMVNGTRIQAGDCFMQLTQSNNTHITTTISSVLNLSTSDYVQGTFTSSTASVNFYSSTSRNIFCGYLVG